MCACNEFFVCSRCKGTPFDPAYYDDEPGAFGDLMHEHARAPASTAADVRGERMSNHLAACERDMQAILDRQRSSSSDLEDDHTDADAILVRALRLLGYEALADLFERVDKWYA